LLKSLAGILGLLMDDPEVYLRGEQKTDGLSDDEIDNLVQKRVDAKSNKDWTEADSIRDQLKEQGIIVEDNAQGSSWRRG